MNAETYSPGRSIAIHEAGHAVMAYLLRRPFTKVSVVEDYDSYGRMEHRLPRTWFRPVSTRTRAIIEDRIMVCLAGSETESAWCARVDAPGNWQDRVGADAIWDMRNATDLAEYVAGGSVPALEAYVEWLRQMVLNYTGRGPGFDVTSFSPDAPDDEIRHYRHGNERFWTLVTKFADALQSARAFSWREARDILMQADPYVTAPTTLVSRGDE